MVNAAQIPQRVANRLADLSGLRAKVHTRKCRVLHGAADFVVQLGPHHLVVETKSSASAGVVANAVRQVTLYAREFSPHAIPVLVVPFMGDTGRRICQEAGVGFVDLSGNAHVSAPPLVIHVEGRKNAFVRRGRPASVFAPRSSRVARLLLLDPARWWRQQELARAGSLGAGYVSRICKRLEEDRLVDRNNEHAVRPRDPDLLLDTWQNHYDFLAHDILRGHVSARSGEELTERVSNILEGERIRHAMTGLAAAWRLAPFAGYRLVTAYVENGRDDRILEALKWNPAERGANLWLVHPNDAGVFHGAMIVKGANCVSPVQAYLDLNCQPERSDEAAAHLKEELLKWR